MSTMLDVWMWRVVLLVAGSFALLLWWLVLEAPILSSLGSDVTARLEDVHPWRHRGGGHPDGRHFDVVYNFYIGGHREVGYATIDTAGAAPPKAGDPIQVKVLYVWPRYRSQPKNRESQITGPCCISVFATVFTIAWVTGTIMVWHPRLRERRIIRRGIAVIGSVAQKVEKPGEYIIWYRFAANDGQIWGDKAEMSREKLRQYETAQPVLVVYLPHRPRESVLYEASKYRVR